MSSDNPHVRHELAVDAPQPVPDDPAVAALAATILDDYEVGRASWVNNAAGARGELDRAGATGVDTAVWVLERSLAGLDWELDFWIRESGRHDAGGPLRERYPLTAQARPNPFDIPSGFHPFIHLVAAAEVLTAAPRGAVIAGTLAGVLEHWFAYAELSGQVEDLEITVLETLVGCYRANASGAPPTFLTQLAGEQVHLRHFEKDDVYSRAPNGVTYVTPRTRPTGHYDLSELARSATRR